MKSRIVYAILLGIIIVSICACKGLEADAFRKLPRMTTSTSSETSTVVSAVLLECPKSSKSCASGNNAYIKQAQCEPQLMVNVRVNPSFHIEKVEKFLILDEVYDPRRRSKAKVMCPYLIEISRGEPIMMYPLEFTKDNKSDTHSQQMETSNNCTDENQVDPQDESVKRVISKIANALAPTTKISSVKYKDKEGSTQKKKTKSKVAMTDYDKDDYGYEDFWDTENDESNIKQEMDNTYSGNIDDSYDVQLTNGCGIDDSQQYVANVGVERSFVNEIKDHPRVAQMGLVNNRMQMRSIQNGKNQPHAYKQEKTYRSRKHKKNNPFTSCKDIVNTDLVDFNEIALKQVDIKSDAKSYISDTDRKQQFRTGKQRRNGNHRKSFVSYQKIPMNIRDLNNNYESVRNYNSKNLQNLRADLKNCHCEKPIEVVSADGVNDWVRQSDYVTSNDDDVLRRNSKTQKMKNDDHNKINADFQEDYDESYADPYYNSIDKEYDYKSSIRKQRESGNDTKENSRSIENQLEIPKEMDYLPFHSSNINNRQSLENSKQTPSSMKISNYPPFRRKPHFNRPESNKYELKTNGNYERLKGTIMNKKLHKQSQNDFIKISEPKHHIESLLKNQSNNRLFSKAKLDNDNRHYNNNTIESDVLTDGTFKEDLWKVDKIDQELSEYSGNKALVKFKIQQNSEWLPTYESDSIVISKGETTMKSVAEQTFDDSFEPEDKPFQIDTMRIHENGNPMYEKPYYEKLLEKSSHNITDNMHVTDLKYPKNGSSDKMLKKCSRELKSSTRANLTAFPIPFGNSYKSDKKIRENVKKKRSFLMYDDLHVHDTFEDNDYNFDDVEQQSSSSQRRFTEEVDTQPCSSCGKGKKVHGKAEQSLNIDSNCDCRNQRSSCRCDPLKTSRSIADTWYSVYNMNAPMPFLTTKIQIFRKRRNIWWKIAPSITLNSFSGIFANENLSILFSSHVDIFQLEKSLRLKNHQLLIPSANKPMRAVEKLVRKTNQKFVIDGVVIDVDSLNVNPEKMIVVDRHKFKRKSTAPIYFEGNISKKSTNSKSIYQSISELRNRFIYTISDLGYFPTTMNLLEQCPNDNNRLCLNILDDKVPAYSVKVKMPFRENALLYNDMFKVKITKVIADATTGDALQISVEIMNEGTKADKFNIGIFNCPFPTANTILTEEKILLPNVGETITFLLPLLIDSSLRDKKISCEVMIKATDTNSKIKAAEKTHFGEDTTKIVAMRQLIAETKHRCFCIWECSCHCVAKLETHVDYNVCQKMGYIDEKRAGLFLKSQPPNIIDECMNYEEDIEKPIKIEITLFTIFFKNAIILLFVMLSLGILKATLGRFCFEKIDKWGYDFIQHGRGYNGSSRSRRFCANTFFFVLIPFLFWCKCFTPNAEDLLVASTEWHCSIIQQNQMETLSDVLDDDEEEILTQHFQRKFSLSASSDRLTGGRDALDVYDRLKNLNLAFQDNSIFDENAIDNENTKFIVEALIDSRESIEKMVPSSSDQSLALVKEHDDKSDADDLVRALKDAQIVYRTFNCPMGNMQQIPYGVKYCIQGYFLPSYGTEYEFISYNPLAQYYCFTQEGTKLESLRPPIMLCPKLFSRGYKTKTHVLEAGDLSVNLPCDAPCINVLSTPNDATQLNHHQSIIDSLIIGRRYANRRLKSLIARKCTSQPNVSTSNHRDIDGHLITATNHPIKRDQQQNKPEDPDSPA